MILYKQILLLIISLLITKVLLIFQIIKNIIYLQIFLLRGKNSIKIKNIINIDISEINYNDI